MKNDDWQTDRKAGHGHSSVSMHAGPKKGGAGKGNWGIVGDDSAAVLGNHHPHSLQASVVHKLGQRTHTPFPRGAPNMTALFSSLSKAPPSYQSPASPALSPPLCFSISAHAPHSFLLD